MKIKIIPKDPKLAKNPAVKKWLREVAKRVEKIMVEQDAQRKMAEAMAFDAPLHVSSSGKITVLSSFYIPRPENLKVHGYQINSKPMTATEVREGQAARDRIIDDFYTAAPKYRTKKQLKKLLDATLTPPEMPGFIEAMANRIAMNPNVMDKLDMEKVKRELKQINSRKRSKVSYKGDHYQT